MRHFCKKKYSIRSMFHMIDELQGRSIINLQVSLTESGLNPKQGYKSNERFPYEITNSVKIEYNFLTISVR